MQLSMPETGRITLTLTTGTIKALRLLALLKDESHNKVVEALLIAGGLHNAVDTTWIAGMPEQPRLAAMSPRSLIPPSSTPNPLPTPNDHKLDGMPEIPLSNSSDEELPPWQPNQCLY